MSDDPTSDALSRASAYLDGELDAAETAAVEADPEVMAEVALLRSLRHEIRDLPAPSPYGRDMAVAAALTEFDTLHRTATPVPSIRAARRPHYGRWMAVAAAIAGVAVLGAVITTGGRGGDGDRDSAALSAEQSAVALDDAAAERSSAGGAPAAPQPQAQSQTMLAAEEAESPAATNASPADQAAGAGASDTFAAATTAAPASSLAAAEATSATEFDPTTPIPDEVALGRIGRQLLSEWKDGLRVTKTGTACDAAVPDAVLLSDAVLTIDGANRAVLISGDPEDETISALDPASCVVIVTGR